MTNAQAALIAASNQVSGNASRKVIISDKGGRRAVDIQVATLLIARQYLTWLNQQDELTAALSE